MDEKLIKLMAQLGLLAVIVWVLAGAFGQRDKVIIKSPPRRMKAKGGVWNHTPTAGPFPPGVQGGVAWVPQQIFA
jgi:hypothetical protein